MLPAPFIGWSRQGEVRHGLGVEGVEILLRTRNGQTHTRRLMLRSSNA